MIEDCKCDQNTLSLIIRRSLARHTNLRPPSEGPNENKQTTIEIDEAAEWRLNAERDAARLRLSRRASPDRQFWVGKMPTSATQKLRTRKGCWFGWGWPPPVLPIMLAAKVMAAPPVPQMFTSEIGLVSAFDCAGMWPDGFLPVALSRAPVADTTIRWLCAAISGCVSVWLTSPSCWPCTSPWPVCAGTRPVRLGSPKVVWPFPP